MFYCNECGKKEGWPEDTLFKSFGPCEICKVSQICNDVQSKYLPEKKESDREQGS